LIVRRNLILSFVQRHLQLLVSVASVIVLSRLISPEETGVFSIGVAIAALTHAIRDFGVGNFLVKESDITHPKIQTAFTVSLLIAGVLSVVLLGASFPVAAFYHKPEVGSVIVITTIGLLISPLSTIPLALLLRQQRFADMFKVSMGSSLANAGISVLFGWLGFGAKALALGQLGMSLALVVGANLVIRDWSIYRLSLAHWREISNFGLHMTVSGVSEQMGQRASDLVVGKLVSFSAVGLLSRSGTLVTMVQDSVQSAVMPVVLTTMASDLRKTGNAAPLLLKSLSYFTAVMWPVYGVISLFAYDAIAVLFGAKWIEAAPYTSVLCYGAALAVLSSLVSTTCNATNQAHLLSRYSAASQGIRVVLIAIGALSASLGTIVRLLVAAEALQCVLAYFLIRRATSIQLRDVVHHCWRSLLAALLVMAAVMPLQALDCLPALRLLIVFFASALAWVAAMFITRHPMAQEITHALGFVLLRMRALRTR
jgi:O-antigen/teichoic acid export membrane protein